jgi:hypothetical protein
MREFSVASYQLPVSTEAQPIVEKVIRKLFEGRRFAAPYASIFPERTSVPREECSAFVPSRRDSQFLAPFTQDFRPGLSYPAPPALR